MNERIWCDCPKCGKECCFKAEYRGDIGVCDKCGAEFRIRPDTVAGAPKRSLRPCPACGQDLSTKALMCPKCGHPLAKAGGETNTRPIQSSGGGGLWGFLTKPRQLGVGVVGTILLILFIGAKIAMIGKAVLPPARDDSLSRKVVGSWTATFDIKDGNRGSGTVTYFPNGTNTFSITATIAGKNFACSGSSTWRIEGNKIHTVITQSSNPELLPVGKTDVDDIVKLTDTELITRDKDGDTEIWHRIGK